eukprot:Seg4377.2 transcript_id=Seg4377.2/GoldUCD/mRNA.D3Y31 product="hypothetical protein" protein_id=Seg4377.2/GoldUCD/D3Y31
MRGDTAGLAGGGSAMTSLEGVGGATDVGNDGGGGAAGVMLMLEVEPFIDALLFLPFGTGSSCNALDWSSIDALDFNDPLLDEDLDELLLEILEALFVTLNVAEGTSGDRMLSAPNEGVGGERTSWKSIENNL